MTFEILDDDGNVVNRIIASVEFVEAHHPGQYREVPQPLDEGEAS